MTPPIPRITVLGSLNIDLVAYVPHHPLPGETLTASRFAVSPGGKGANQAVACAKLSRSSRSGDGDATATAHVRMVGRVGADSYGDVLLGNLRRHGVDVSGVEVVAGGEDAKKTGVALIVVDEPTGQNRIVVSPEANHAIGPADAAAAALQGSPPPDLLVMQLEIPVPAVVEALAAARRAGIPALLNPAPANVALPDDALRGLAHLVANEGEAAALAGCAEAELDDEAGVARAAAALAARGVDSVVVTLGGRGVYFLGGGGRGPSGLVPAEKADVVDTTAAGDTFVGQYALEVVASGGSGGGGGGFDIEAAVKKANRAAARTVERAGAQDSIPWRDELV